MITIGEILDGVKNGMVAMGGLVGVFLIFFMIINAAKNVIELITDNVREIKWHIPSLPTAAKRAEWPNMSFETFLRLYQIDPSKWDVTYSDTNMNNNDFVQYKSKAQASDMYKGYKVILDENHQEFIKYTNIYWTTLRDRRKFRKWLKQYRRNKSVQQSKEDMLRVMEDIQRSIEARMNTIEQEKQAELARIEKEKQQVAQASSPSSYHYKTE